MADALDPQTMQALQAAKASAPSSNGIDPQTLDTLRKLAAMAQQEAPRPTVDGQPVGDESAAVGAGMIEGVPIAGPIVMGGVDRGVAALRAMGLGRGPARSYADELKHVQAWRAGTEKENPGSTTGGRVAGAVLSTIPVMAAAPAAFGMNAAEGLGVNTLVGAATGTGIGGTDAAIRSGGDLVETGKGAALGLLGGAGGPLISRGASAVADTIRGLPEEFNNLSKPARDYIIGRLAPLAERHQAAMRELGPLAMPADVSSEWRNIARAGAGTPGTSDEITQALVERARGLVPRLQADRSAALGERVIPSRIQGEARDAMRGIVPEEGTIEGNIEALSPQYEDVLSRARAVDSSPIANWIDSRLPNVKGEAETELQRVRGWLDVRGSPGTLDRSPEALQAARTALRTRIQALEDADGDRNVISNLKEVYGQMTDTLEQSVPGLRDVNSMRAELGRQTGALEKGQTLLDADRTNVMRPEETRLLMERGTRPTGTMQGPSAEAFRLRQGLNADIDRKIGTAPNDLQALRRVVGGEGDYAGGNLAEVFGPRAEILQRGVARENAFQQAANRITGGSDTAPTLEFMKKVAEIRQGLKVDPNATGYGDLKAGALRVLNSFLGRQGEAQAERFASELSRLSVATGDKREALVRAMIESNRGQPISPLVLQSLAALGQAPTNYLRMKE